MMNVPPLLMTDVSLVAARVAIVLAALWWVSRAIERAPLAPKHRQLAERLAPIAMTVLVSWLTLSSAAQLFGTQSVPLALWAGLLAGAIAVALWVPLRDLLAGVIIKAGRSLQVGDEISLQHARGRVEKLGLRGIVLRTAAGETFVPYGLYTRAIVMRSARARGARTHCFRVRPLSGVSQAELRRTIRESVLLCHWSSPAREPVLSSLDDGVIEVHVAAIDDDYASEIEAGVRRRLEMLERTHSIERIASLSQLPAANHQSQEPQSPERKDARKPR